MGRSTNALVNPSWVGLNIYYWEDGIAQSYAHHRYQYGCTHIKENVLHSPANAIYP